MATLTFMVGFLSSLACISGLVLIMWPYESRHSSEELEWGDLDGEKYDKD